MTACKQTASMGAAATDSKSAAEERKPSKKGKKARGKLAVKSNGAEKPKTHDLSDVTRGLAEMGIAEEKSDGISYVSVEQLALWTYQNDIWMKNFKSVRDRPSVDAIRKKAADQWKLFNNLERAPYLAIARVNRIILAEVDEFEKTLELTDVMTNKMMNLKM